MMRWVSMGYREYLLELRGFGLVRWRFNGFTVLWRFPY